MLCGLIDTHKKPRRNGVCIVDVVTMWTFVEINPFISMYYR